MPLYPLLRLKVFNPPALTIFRLRPASPRGGIRAHAVSARLVVHAVADLGFVAWGAKRISGGRPDNFFHAGHDHSEGLHGARTLRDHAPASKTYFQTFLYIYL